jgi:hypothetical protein
MTFVLLSTLPYVISETALYEYITPGAYLWSLLPATLLLLFFIYKKVKEADWKWSDCYDSMSWKRNLLIQVLCAVVAYMDMVSEMETLDTPLATIQPRTQSIWQALIAIPIVNMVSLTIRRKKVYALCEKDFDVYGWNWPPITTLVFGQIAMTMVAILGACMTDQVITRTFVFDIILLLIKEQLQGREVCIPLLVFSTCVYRFLFTADWRCAYNMDSSCVHGDNALIAIGMGILIVIMLYSLIYLCQKSTIFLPAILTCGSRIVLEKRTVTYTMMGLVIVIVASFHWYFEDELMKNEEPVQGHVITITTPIVSSPSTSDENSPLIQNREGSGYTDISLDTQRGTCVQPKIEKS